MNPQTFPQCPSKGGKSHYHHHQSSDPWLMTPLASVFPSDPQHHLDWQSLGPLFWQCFVFACSFVCPHSRDFFLYPKQTVIGLDLQHPFGLTIFADTMYWSDWQTQSIHVANKVTGAERGILLRNLAHPMDLKVFHRNREQGMCCNALLDFFSSNRKLAKCQNKHFLNTLVCL